jgi:hypothetical protein
VPSQVLQYDPEQAEVKAQYKRLKNMVKMLETVTAHPSPALCALAANGVAAAAAAPSFSSGVRAVGVVINASVSRSVAAVAVRAQVDKHLAKSFNHKAVAALDELLSEVSIPLWPRKCRQRVPRRAVPCAIGVGAASRDGDRLFGVPLGDSAQALPRPSQRESPRGGAAIYCYCPRPRSPRAMLGLWRGLAKGDRRARPSPVGARGRCGQ